MLTADNWLDGAMLDLGVIAAACRRVGAALVLDQSQAFGIVPFSAKAIDPDFAVGVGEKWLFGPYGISYLYVARRWQDAAPLEQGWASRVHGLDPDHLLDYDDHYAAGARRFDTDERFNYMLLPQALAGLQQVAAWGGPATIAAALKRTIESIAARAAALGLTATPAAVRAPHIVGLRGGTRPLPVGLGASLARRGVYASVRAGIVRVAPHLHNDERDIEALFAALAEALKQAA